jgi:hypothetical protein
MWCTCVSGPVKVRLVLDVLLPDVECERLRIGQGQCQRVFTFDGENAQRQQSRAVVCISVRLVRSVPCSVTTKYTYLS